MKKLNSTQSRILPFVLPTLSILLSGCMTASKDGSLAVAGLAYEQKGESSLKVDGEQIKGVLSEMGKLADKVETVATVGGQIKSTVSAVSAIASDAKEKATEAAKDASGAKEKAVQAENVSANAKDAVAEAKKEAEMARTKADALAADLGITKEQLAAARKSLDQFDSEIKTKLQNISGDQVREIAKLKDDRAKFDEKVQDTLTELKLSDSQIKEFKEKTKGMSTEEILAILTAAAGAAGAGGIIAKTGKSRAQPQIDKLDATVRELQHSTVKKPTRV